MTETITPEVLSGFREMLREFRGVGEALGEVVERTARLETKVDRLVVDVAQASMMQDRLASLESWVQAELQARAARGVRRGVWIAALATIAGGAIGALISHLLK